jgi:hypothetical protein
VLGPEGGDGPGDIAIPLAQLLDVGHARLCISYVGIPRPNSGQVPGHCQTAQPEIFPNSNRTSAISS